MAHLVIIGDSVLSKRSTLLELARRLLAAGHRVTVLSAGEPPATAAGIDSERLDLRLRPFAAGRVPGSIRQRFRLRRERRAAAVAAVDVAAFEGALQRLAPDLLLIDIECHECVMAARRAGRPVGLLNVFFSLWKRPGCPPLDSAVQPTGNLRIHRAWLRLEVSKAYRRLREFVRTGGLDRASLLNAYAREIGFPPDALDRSQWLIPFVYRGLPVLTLNAVELEFPHRPHPESRYVGPLLREPATPAAGVSPGRAGLEQVQAVLEDHAGSGGRTTLIYAGFGALRSADGARFWKLLVGALGSRPDRVAILGLGGVVRAEALAPLPANVHAVDWAPQIRILEQAACAVIHGGMTSVYECIRAGVPMVVCPFRVNDQLGTAARVAFHGLGVTVDRDEADPETIERAIHEVLTDPGYRERVARMGERLIRYDRDGVAVAAVEALLGWGAEGLPPGWASLPPGPDRPI